MWAPQSSFLRPLSVDVLLFVLLRLAVADVRLALRPAHPAIGVERAALARFKVGAELALGGGPGGPGVGVGLVGAVHHASPSAARSRASMMSAWRSPSSREARRSSERCFASKKGDRDARSHAGAVR